MKYNKKLIETYKKDLSIKLNGNKFNYIYILNELYEIHKIPFTTITGDNFVKLNFEDKEIKIYYKNVIRKEKLEKIL